MYIIKYSEMLFKETRPVAERTILYAIQGCGEVYIVKFIAAVQTAEVLHLFIV